ncbi:helix-turn-helix transcriptional regulator [Paenibacillus sp. p3-SID867]|uniref:winged helix-turn-helix transcriptional regulator n=1 Tax=Paenibacillus sp. p3-SID867 TaxID=2916363 RepID=UPI0021A475F1|nr:helix-turn-helix domain-containing protein [Paenibacillus sp. p3-SID867]MCT1398249.1 helix-turn-helix transcriptional regulator [Paenibacillus sp. p3-SID867]
MPYQDERNGCPAEVGLHMISGKWKPRVLYELFQETLRFGELHRRIPEVSRHVLTVQLRELEENGIVKRTVYQEVPPKVEYSITEFGIHFKAVLEQMVILGQQYINTKQVPNE